MSASVIGALFSAIWQGTVLAACVALCLRLLPGLSAAARSVIWMNVFAMLVLLHVLPAFSQHSTSVYPDHAPPLHLDMRWSIGLASVWAMLSLWRAAQLIVSAIRLHRMANRATPVHPDPTLQTLLRQKGGQRGRAAELCTSTEVERPSVFGFFRPRILIPPGLVESLSAIELQQVVLHEMEHLRRADDWSNLLQKMALVLFPLNPALLWVERRICAERELACDDRVQHSSAGRKAYAICLTRLAEYSILNRGLTLVLGAWERQSELVRRVHRILRRPANSMSGKAAMVATTGLIVGALGCAIALARSPQLVSFTQPTQSTLQARSDFHEMNARELSDTAQLVKVKAVTPQRPPQSRAPQAQGVALKRPVLARTVRRQPAPTEQSWVVLTEWQVLDAPPQLVIAVDHETQSRYAAVQIANGWLIVQI
jgi:beta-lactamase regulating signal transducer with metallopeptidase domain